MDKTIVLPVEIDPWKWDCHGGKYSEELCSLLANLEVSVQQEVSELLKIAHKMPDALVNRPKNTTSITVPMEFPIDAGMGGGGLEVDLTFGNIWTKWLLIENFTTEITATLYLKKIEELNWPNNTKFFFLRVCACRVRGWGVG